VERLNKEINFIIFSSYGVESLMFNWFLIQINHSISPLVGFSLKCFSDNWNDDRLELSRKIKIIYNVKGRVCGRCNHVP